MSFTVAEITADDWEAFRDIRLRMLQDTPLAYGETYEASLRIPEAEWRSRAGRGQEPHNASFVAVAEDGTWIGIMRGYVSQARGPMLISVFVDPGWRSRATGVADALLDAVIEWARGEGDTLRLEVHADNPRAAAFYARRGFVPTGNRRPYELPPHGDEVEMELPLGR
ncbi:GNAT family N-acetyltransferase [Microbacterium sp. JZ31]|uniref:GNAT family N-acetyltransferase n=1 Tax=Microbacterium sp. JZ31 TaxID=1906274 RepID=UPI0019314042|nr:GNAT family N-acetyltransferase [Microbacterium sp. JZ31]